MQKQRLAYLDFLRILAILCIIFNHTSGRGFYLFVQHADSPLYPLYLCLSIVCKVGVPLFWMVSGAVLIDREEGIRTVLCRRVGRMLAVLVLFSLVQYLYGLWVGGGSFSLSQFGALVYSSNLAVAYWFLYAYIGMLLMLPLIRRLAVNMRVRDFVYLVAIVTLLRNVVPLVQYLVCRDAYTLNPSLLGNFFTQSMLFFLGGYFFAKRLPQPNGKQTALLFVSGAAAIVLTALMMQLRFRREGITTDESAEVFFNNLILFPTYAIFCGARLLFRRCGERLSRLVSLLGRASFGVMLTENILRDRLSFIFTAAERVLPTLLACGVWVLCVWLAGTALTLILRCIPVLRKLL